MRRGGRLALLAALSLAACAGQRGVAHLKNPPIVTAVAFAKNDMVQALAGGRLLVWTGFEPSARTVEMGYIVALAADGSMMATLGSDEKQKQRDRVDVWSRVTGMRAYTHTFPDGIRGVTGMSPSAALVVVENPIPPDMAMAQVLPRNSRALLWRFDGDVVSELYNFETCSAVFEISRDGKRLLCDPFPGGLEWLDLDTHHSASADLAADWKPPPSPEDDFQSHRRPQLQPPDWYYLLSARLAPAGRDVYLTYQGTEEHHPGWRLERWTPKPLDHSGGTFERLASSDVNARTQILAVSPDGRLLVMGGDREPPSLRRAPTWAAQPLPAPPATAAAFSAEGNRFATGHLDGSLRLWDSANGGLHSTATP